MLIEDSYQTGPDLGLHWAHVILLVFSCCSSFSNHSSSSLEIFWISQSSRISTEYCLVVGSGQGTMLACHITFPEASEASMWEHLQFSKTNLFWLQHNFLFPFLLIKPHWSISFEALGAIQPSFRTLTKSCTSKTWNVKLPILLNETDRDTKHPQHYFSWKRQGGYLMIIKG